jgi:hypothetical protein
VLRPAWNQKQAVLESTIDYVKMEINGKLELVCAHKYGSQVSRFHTPNNTGLVKKANKSG